MSIYLPGVQFAGKRITPSDDGSVFASCIADGFHGCDVSVSGTSLRLSVGRIIACGRAVRVASQTDIPMAQTSGFARLVLTLDRSKPDAQQRALDVEYANSEESFPALVQNDINNGGTKYQVCLCLASLTSSTTTILWKIGPAHGKGLGILVDLPSAGWSGNSQTVRVNGVHADSNIVVTYAPAYKTEWLSADIDCTAQSEGKLTFTAAAAPATLVKANVLLL